MKMLECEVENMAYAKNGQFFVFKCAMEHEGRLHRVRVVASNVAEADAIAQNVVLRLCKSDGGMSDNVLCVLPPVSDCDEPLFDGDPDNLEEDGTLPAQDFYDEGKDDGKPPSVRQKKLYIAMCLNLGKDKNKTARARWGVKKAEEMTGYQCWKLANELLKEAEATPVRDEQIMQCVELCSSLHLCAEDLIGASGRSIDTMSCADMGLIIKGLRDKAIKQGCKV